MKVITKILTVVIILVLFAVLVSFDISGLIFNNSSFEYDYTNSWTKAICNETSCQDYIIYCDGNEFVKQTPISGAVIFISEDWEDPRDETTRKKVCDVY